MPEFGAGNTGIANLFQGFAQQDVHWAIANGSTTTFDFYGFGAALSTLGGGLTTNARVGNGTYYASLGSIIETSVANINQQYGFGMASAGYSVFQSSVGNSRVGNYFVSFTFRIESLNADGRFFCGTCTFNTPPTSAALVPSAQPDLVGFAKDSGDTTLQVLSAAAAGSGIKTDTKIPTASLVGIGLTVTVQSFVSAVTLTMTNIDTGIQLYKQTVQSPNSPLPRANTQLSPFVSASTGPTVAAARAMSLRKLIVAVPTL